MINLSTKFEVSISTHYKDMKGKNPMEFQPDLWRDKTGVLGLSYGIVCMIVSLAILVQYWLVTDGQTDKQTQDDRIYCASIELCSKN